jgi:hypothetical protein
VGLRLVPPCGPPPGPSGNVHPAAWL